MCESKKGVEFSGGGGSKTKAVPSLTMLCEGCSTCPKQWSKIRHFHSSCIDSKSPSLYCHQPQTLHTPYLKYFPGNNGSFIFHFPQEISNEDPDQATMFPQPPPAPSVRRGFRKSKLPAEPIKFTLLHQSPIYPLAQKCYFPQRFTQIPKPANPHPKHLKTLKPQSPEPIIPKPTAGYLVGNEGMDPLRHPAVIDPRLTGGSRG